MTQVIGVSATEELNASEATLAPEVQGNTLPQGNPFPINGTGGSVEVAALEIPNSLINASLSLSQVESASQAARMDELSETLPIICMYGPAKGGKTLQMARVMPNDVVIAHRKGDLLASVDGMGVSPHIFCSPQGVLSIDYVIQVMTQVIMPHNSAAEAKIQEIMQTVPEAQGLSRKQIILRFVPSGQKPIRWLGIDDLSLACDNQLEAIDRKLGSGNKNKFKRWANLRDDLVKMIKIARSIGLGVIMSAHENSPDPANGLEKGGPKAGSKAMTAEIPKYMDLILHVTAPKTGIGGPQGEWPYKFDLSQNHCLQWEVGARREGFWLDEPTPLNLAEILRKAGYEIDYPYGYEWLGFLVDKGFDMRYNQRVSGDAVKKVLYDTWQKIASQNPNKWGEKWEFQWVLRDLRDRLTLYEHSPSNSELSAFDSFVL